MGPPRNSAKMHRHPCCKPGFRGELCELLEALLRESQRFFDKNDCLNSDGKRLFETIVRMLLGDHSEYNKLVKQARRHPCLEKVLRVASVFYDCDALWLYRVGRGSIVSSQHKPYRGVWKRIAQLKGNYKASLT